MPDQGRWTSNGGDPNLNDINRVDRFIEALSADQPVYSTDPAEAELAFLMADWRDGVRDTPVSAVVTERDAAIALDAARAPRRPNRLSLAVIGSAAAAVLCAGGFGVAVYGASPGDGLYGMRTMIFGEQQATRDDQVVLAAQQELAQVQQLVDDGQWDQAQDRLAALSTTVQSVETVEQKSDLIQQWNALTYKVVEQDPAATLPPVGDPAPVLLPDSPLTLLPVPVVTQTTETTTTSGTSTETSATTTTATTTTGTTTTGTTTSATDTPGPELATTTPSDPGATPTSPTSGVPSPTSATSPTSASPTSASPTSASPTPTTTAPPATTSTLPTTTAAPTTTVPPTTTTTTVQATTTTRPQAPVPSVVETPASQAPVAPSQSPTTAVEQTPITTTVIVPGGAG